MAITKTLVRILYENLRDAKAEDFENMKDDLDNMKTDIDDIKSLLVSLNQKLNS